jgi:hypothetical protein
MACKYNGHGVECSSMPEVSQWLVRYFSMRSVPCIAHQRLYRAWLKFRRCSCVHVGLDEMSSAFTLWLDKRQGELLVGVAE